MVKAEKALESALRDLARDPKRMSYKAQVVGLLVGMMVAATGHRKCVFVQLRPLDMPWLQSPKQQWNTLRDSKNCGHSCLATIKGQRHSFLQRLGKPLTKWKCILQGCGSPVVCHGTPVSETSGLQYQHGYVTFSNLDYSVIVT